MSNIKRRKGGSNTALTVLGALSLQAAGAGLGTGCSSEDPNLTNGEVSTDFVPHAMADSLTRGAPQIAIVDVDDARIEKDVREAQRQAGTTGSYQDYLARKKAQYDARKQAVMAALPEGSFELQQDYQNLPMMVLKLSSPAALAELSARPEVKGIYEDQQVNLFLTQSLPLIDQPEAEAAGKDGTGVSVAVLDTGTDYTQEAFGSCEAAGGDCKVAYAYDFATDDNDVDANGHGTNVAGIVLGVAPAAKILALDVFNGATASSTDIIEAIDWCVSNKETYSIAAMNMSLGSGSYTEECSGNIFATPVATAYSAGILSVIATGNDGYTNKIASPACVPNAVRVGAVYDSNVGAVSWSGCTDNSTSADKVTCFSNSADFITLLAPGAMITAAGLTQGGTSQATPHVAGAVAVLRGAFENETLADTVTRMTSTGKSVTDTRNSVVKPRLDLDDAATGCVDGVVASDTSYDSNGGDGTITVSDSCEEGWTAVSGADWLVITDGASGSGAGTVTFTVSTNDAGPRTGIITVQGTEVSVTQTGDVDGPTGTVSINAGDEYTSSTTVSLTLDATDANTVSKVCLSNSTSCSTWKTYAETMSWTLASGTGSKKVYVWFKDEFGNASTTAAQDTIFLDATLPKDGTLQAAGSDGAVALTWSGFSDQNSGLDSYKLVFSTSGEPASCSKGTVLYEGEDLTFAHESLTNGTVYYYRVCALDVAGNVSAGAVATRIPAPEYDAPANAAVVINSADEYTKDPKVTLTISGEDDNTISKMCISNTTTCTAWVTYAASKSWTLDSGTGVRTVRVWLQDEFQNTTTAAASDAILLDTTLPKDGTAAAVPADGELAITWTGFSDKDSGISKYKLMWALTTAPADCNKGTLAYEGTNLTYTHSSLENGKTLGYRLCAVDNAGNMSLGYAFTAIPAPETAAPTNGAVVINEGALWTNKTAVTLALDADDANDITKMCISNTTTCTTWTTFAASKSWTLASGDGAKTVRVWFMDEFQNATTTAASAAISLDSVLPKDGTVQAAVDDGEVALTWSGFTDAKAGVASYKVVYAAGTTAPAACNKGTELYAGSDLTYTHASLTNGLSYSYRVCAVDTAGNMSAGAIVTAVPTTETDPPTDGSVQINDETSEYTNDPKVVLTLSATDDNDVTQMCISNTTTCTAWVAYAAEKAWTLDSGDGVRTVRVWFKDEYQNATTEAVSDAITVDTALPTGGALEAAGSDGAVALTWSGFTDAASGVASYKLVYSLGTAPASCAKGTVLYEGEDLTFAHESLTNGQIYAYRVCAIDAAGNLSAGAAATAVPAPETDAPTDGLVLINGEAEFTNNAKVTLALSATDDNAVSQMCISNTSTCTAWTAFAAEKSWNLTSGDGAKTVSVWFKDEFQNATETPATGVITVDTVAPTQATLGAIAGDTEVVLEWAGGEDASSGVGSYKLVYAVGTAPADCNKGSVAYEGEDLTYTHTGLVNGTIYAYRLCTVDVAGNTGAGTTTVAIPTTETDPPADGTVQINGVDDVYVNTPKVTLTLAATDDNAVAYMCISNTETCTSWVAFAETKAWTLTSGDGEKTVYVWFKDELQNATTDPVTDTITVDTALPVDGEVEAAADDGIVTLTWSGFSDAGSDVASYKVVRAQTTAPTACNKGEVVYEGETAEYADETVVNGLIWAYRVCALDTAGNVSAGVGVTAIPAPEYDIPTDGTVQINGETDEYTNSTKVTLTLAATDASAVTSMCISTADTCTAWVTFAETKSFTLPSGEGEKTVNVWFRDEYLNATVDAASDTITLDTTLPTDGSLEASADDSEVVLGWDSFTDELSGVASYKLVYAVGTAPASCSKGTVIYEGEDTTFTHSSLQNGQIYSYRVCALDTAGNVSAGATATAIPTTETDPPTDGAVQINGETDEYTNDVKVTLTLAATDDSALAQVCISNTDLCDTWQEYAETLSWTLASGDGEKTVSVWFKDELQNESLVPATDSIIVDTALPVDGTVEAAAGDAEVVLTWSGYSDDGSGVASYKVVYQTGSAPSACNKGDVAYEGEDETFTHEGVTNGTTYGYRVCALDAAGNVSAGAGVVAIPSPETDAPADGAVIINAEEDEYTNSVKVTLSLSATDASALSQVCVSNTDVCSTWKTYAETLSWTLASEDGEKTVYVWFKDEFQNATTDPATDTITLDTTLPEDGAFDAAADDGTVTLTWSGATDALSGVASYKLVFATGTTPPATCAKGEVAYEGTDETYAHESLTNGTSYAYRLCALDTAGNTSAGMTAVAVPTPETDAPTDGAVVINAEEDEYTKSATVTLTLSATDDSTVSQMCISNTDTCSAWQSFVETKSWTLASGNGVRTVYVWFKDEYQNATTDPAMDTITLDTTLPTDGTADAASGDAEVVLTWDGFADAGSSIASYKLVFGTTGAPASCAKGTVLYEGEDLTFTHDGLTNGLIYYYRLCAIDGAGNVSAGVVKTAVPATETDPPTNGAVIINAEEDTYTSSGKVTLTLSADDASEITEMCISNTSSCSAWIAFAETKSWQMDGNKDGEKTVYAWFRDANLNATTDPATDAIILDSYPPTGGSVTAEGDDGVVTLVWTGFTDVTSGVESYKVVYATGAAPSDCKKGTVAYEGEDLTYAHESLTNGTVYGYRVCAIDAAGNLSAGVATTKIPAPEYDAPSDGSVAINEGDDYTNDAKVTLTLSATDDNTVAGMCISNTSTCTAWIAYAETKSWSLESGNGTRTVYVWFKDEFGNTTSSAVSSAIYLDTTLPVDGAVVAAADDGTVALTWSGFSDKHTAVASYKVVGATTSAPTDCNKGTVLYEGADTTFTHESLTNGTIYGYRVCAIDEAGNRSLGATATAIPTTETDPPANGAVSINADAEYTNNIKVTLTISAEDDNAISQMCISNTTTCTAWITYAETKSWSLTSGNGDRTVYVWFRDEYKNTTTTAVSDAIYLDTTLPVDGTLALDPDDSTVVLTWAGFSDKHSGVASYKVVFTTGTAPASCSKGTVLYEGEDLTFTHEELTNGQTYAYRVCAIDEAGNVSAGKSGTTIPAPEFDAPASGAVIINAEEDEFANSTTVTLTLSADDESTISKVCISNTTTCTSWVSYAETKSWTLASGTGSKKVYVWFQDEWRNTTTTPVYDDIFLDVTKPVDGSLVVTAGDAENALTWTGFKDKNSGMAGYILVVNNKSAPASCSKGTVAYEGTDTSYTHASLTNGSTYYYRLCAVDEAGNMSVGVTGQGKPVAP